jgi:hypothetical protein
MRICAGAREVTRVPTAKVFGRVKPDAIDRIDHRHGTGAAVSVFG